MANPSVNSARAQCRFEVDYRSGDGITREPFRITPTLTYTNGNSTAAVQANRFYSSTVSITASGNTSVVLSSLTDAFGNSLNLTLARSIVIEHITQTTGSTQVTIGGGTRPLFGSKVSGLELAPGDWHAFNFGKGYTVTATTTDSIRIVNSDATNAASVRVSVLGSQ